MGSSLSRTTNPAVDSLCATHPADSKSNLEGKYMAFHLPDRGEFFHLSDSWASAAVQLTAEPRLADIAFRGECAHDLPLAVSKMTDKPRAHRLMDIVWAVSRPLLSPRAIQALEQAGASGWSKREVLPSPDVSRVSEYRALIVVGRGGEVGPCVGCSEVERETENAWLTKGWCLDRSEWDGSDLWVQRNGACLLIVSARVAGAFRRARISGVRLTDLRDTRGTVGKRPTHDSGRVSFTW